MASPGWRLCVHWRPRGGPERRFSRVLCRVGRGRISMVIAFTHKTQKSSNISYNARSKCWRGSRGRVLRTPITKKKTNKSTRFVFGGEQVRVTTLAWYVWSTPVSGVRLAFLSPTDPCPRDSQPPWGAQPPHAHSQLLKQPTFIQVFRRVAVLHEDEMVRWKRHRSISRAFQRDVSSRSRASRGRKACILG